MPIQVDRADGDSAIDGEGEEPPYEDGGGPSAAAGSSSGSLSDPAAAEVLFLTSYSRYPEEFRQALLEGPHLQRCRQAMSDAGHNFLLPTGAKIFCLSDQYPAVCAAVGDHFPMLRPYHVLATESTREKVEESIRHVRRSAKVKVKSEVKIAYVTKSGQFTPIEHDDQELTRTEGAEGAPLPSPGAAPTDRRPAQSAQRNRRDEAKGPSDKGRGKSRSNGAQFGKAPGRPADGRGNGVGFRNGPAPSVMPRGAHRADFGAPQGKGRADDPRSFGNATADFPASGTLVQPGGGVDPAYALPYPALRYAQVAPVASAYFPKFEAAVEYGNPVLYAAAAPNGNGRNLPPPVNDARGPWANGHGQGLW